MPKTTPREDRSTVALHYEDTGGTGRPVVLIHGWPLSGKAFKDNISALSEAGYRVIAYDRRGFGDSDKPKTGYSYDHLAEDLAGLLEEFELTDVTLVGFSMGGGEVARYVSKHGQNRVHSVVFASAVTPYMLHGGDNPDGPLTKTEATKMTAKLTADSEGFYDDFTTKFFSVDGDLKVDENKRQEALALCEQSEKLASLECMAAFGFTDFRDDLTKVTVPTLVIHGDGDAIVPLEGSGQRTHEAISSSELHAVNGAPHGVNVSHAAEWNQALLRFLER